MNATDTLSISHHMRIIRRLGLDGAIMFSESNQPPFPAPFPHKTTHLEGKITAHHLYTHVDFSQVAAYRTSHRLAPHTPIPWEPPRDRTPVTCSQAVTQIFNFVDIIATELTQKGHESAPRKSKPPLRRGGFHNIHETRNVSVDPF